MTLNVSCSPTMRIKPDTVKTYLEIGQKVALLGGFAILTLHCMEIQRLPDVELPSLIVLFGASCGFFLVMFTGISLLGILPQLVIRNVFHLRRDRSQVWQRASIVTWLPSIWLSCAGWLVLAGFRFRHPRWMTLISLAVIWTVLPVFLTAFTKRYWVRVVAEQSIIINREVNAPAAWNEVLLAFFTWAVCSIGYPFFLSWLMLIVSAPNSEWLLVAVLVLLANLGADLQAYTRPPETWTITIMTIVVPVGLFLFTNNLPRVVFGSLGVGYIFCERGSVLVNKAAADKIWRVLPDAIDRDEPMPVLIQKYDVEIVSKIGKEALLKFSLGPNEHWSEKVFVPTESIADYRQVP
jgi:MFS family permease